MMVLAFLLGLLIQVKMIANLKGDVEAVVLKFIPSLNHLKLMAAERLNADDTVLNWKPVLVLKGDSCFPAYILEENDDWITLATVKLPNTDP